MDRTPMPTPADSLVKGVKPGVDDVEAFLGAGGAAGLLFTASWCTAGVLLVRLFEGDPLPLSAGVAFVVVDCETHPHLADRFQVRSLPTFVLMRGDREEGRLLGAFSPSQVRSLLERPSLARPPRSGKARS